MKYQFMSKINGGIFDDRETLKSLRFATKPSTTKYNPFETIEDLVYQYNLSLGQMRSDVFHTNFTQPL
jgi:hypothetical protein